MNYKILIDELEKDNISSVVICKKVPTGLNSMLRNEKKSIDIMSEILKIFNYYFNTFLTSTLNASAKDLFIALEPLIT